MIRPSIWLAKLKEHKLYYSIYALILLFFFFNYCKLSYRSSNNFIQSDVDSINDYFFEICLKNEFHKKTLDKPLKWEKDTLIIAVKGIPTEKDLVTIDEYAKYISSITGLSLIVNRRSEGDINIYIHNSTFLRDSLSFIFNQKLLDRARSDAGLFVIIPNFKKNNIIKKSYVFINTGVTPYHRKHLILEEFIQSMGFPNDSEKYPNSIFYQGNSRDTVFSSIDSAVIKMLYYK